MENKNQVLVSAIDVDMASVICQNSRDSLYAFLKRMDLYVEPDWDKEVLAMLLRDTILENPEYILSIYGREILDFLIELWESDSVELYQSGWSIVGQLKLLGFVDVKYTEGPDGTSGTIYMVNEARDAFYFYLKSRTAKMLMEHYYIWEVLVRGLLIHYGIISFNRLYYLFCRLIKSPVDDAEFHRFLSVRMELFHFGGFALEKSANVEYYQSYEVTDPEQVLEKRQENSKLDYFFPDYEDVLYIAQNNGMGEWDGIGALAEIFLQLLDIEYYKTVITIKSCILMIQNDESPSQVEEHIYQCCPEGRKYQDKMKSAVLSLYNSVPVYSLKGWNRKSLRKKHRSELPFTMIRGGKDGPNN